MYIYISTKGKTVEKYISWFIHLLTRLNFDVYFLFQTCFIKIILA